MLIDGGQLLYHIVWPVTGTGNIRHIAEGMKERIGEVDLGVQTLIIFDRYEGVRAKDHERQRRAGEGSTEYNIEMNTTLVGRDAILKNTANKRKLIQLLCTQNLGPHISIVGRDSFVKHDEADISLVSYMLEAARGEASTIRIRCDDTDVFVLLVYCTWKENISKCIQMEKWDGTVLNINANVNTLGNKCQGILAMHALSGCDTVSYPWGKGKVSALKTLQNCSMPQLAELYKLGEEEATQSEIMEAAKIFFLTLYSQRKAANMNQARYNLFKQRKKPPALKKLPPTGLNLMLHALRAHLQVLLWKAADKLDPPQITQDITKFGWDITDGVMPVIATQLVWIFSRCFNDRSDQISHP